MATKDIESGQRLKVQVHPYVGLSRRRAMFNIFLTVYDQVVRHVQRRGAASEVPRMAFGKICRRIGLEIRWLSEADRSNRAASVRKETPTDLDVNASVKNVRQRLREFQFRVARRTLRVSASNQLASLAFAKEAVTWTPQRWFTVIVNDESKHDRLESHRDTDARMSEELRINCVKPTARDGGG